MAIKTLALKGLVGNEIAVFNAQVAWTILQSPFFHTRLLAITSLQ
jgi:hypothetical protein